MCFVFIWENNNIGLLCNIVARVIQNKMEHFKCLKAQYKYLVFLSFLQEAEVYLGTKCGLPWSQITIITIEEYTQPQCYQDVPAGKNHGLA